ncbi:MAG: HEPN domain-containing protein [Spirochaetes bacterium]|nr:HEPN domain-containing protein [Spirochaetota bacterium]
MVERGGKQKVRVPRCLQRNPRLWRGGCRACPAVALRVLARNTFYSAQELNKLHRKPIEVICYHCAQSAEKYLKAFLVFHGVVPEKIHKLIILNENCIKIFNDFNNIYKECDLLSKYANEVRYPHSMKIEEEDIARAITAAERIRDFEPIRSLIDMIEKESKPK